MSTIPFLCPRLTGARFLDHAIPLEFLKDLAVLEEMVVEVAKWQFLQEHPDRRRSRRGFAEDIGLALTGVDGGSAVPEISLAVPPGALFPPDQVYLEKARDAIVHAIAAAEQNKPITDFLPEKTLAYFDRLGRSLRDGEAIEFTTPTQETPARLTRETRRKLVLASTTVRELTEETTVRGAVPEADQDDMTFEVLLSDGHKVRAPMAMQHLDTILEAFTGYKSGSRVLLQGVGKFSRLERLLGFESVEHISILDPRDVPSRLDEFRRLRNGWLDGKGRAPTDDGLDWLAHAFEQHFPDDLPLPFLYPTAEGGIQAEWSLDPYEVTLEIDLDRHHGEWHFLSMLTGAPETRDLDLDDPNSWEWLAEQLRQVSGGAA